ncbi:MAG: S-layer homology domain-containing protein, partial [Syntrophomonadaceae bacterium]|nr:S-layer homology domain-containing protein [Syntrophomonadaceae bacterium]
APVALGYSDVSDSDWFKGAVSYASDNGLFQGTGGGQFSPQVSMSRAMYVTVLSRLEQNTFPDVIIAGDGGFSDVAAGVWYTTPVSWAADNDIVNGMGDGLFAPDFDVSREQMVTILYRYCVYNGYAVSEAGNIDSYHDAAQVAEWALDAMRWACGAGVIKGDDMGNLNPQASATRAEAAQMLKNFCEALE